MLETRRVVSEEANSFAMTCGKGMGQSIARTLGMMAGRTNLDIEGGEALLHVEGSE